jgi:hypothetical protein
MEYDKIVRANEEAIRNTSEKMVYGYDNFNLKCNDKLFFIIAKSCNTAKSFSLVFWFLKNMGKDNIVEINSNRDLMRRANISPKTYYKVVNSLIDFDFMVRLGSHKFMINPDIVINFRKTHKADLPETRALYSMYQKL